LANFGQIRHILTDKTGTLTKRKFEVNLCSIDGKLFNLQKNNDNNIFPIEGDNIDELEIIKEAESNSKFSRLFKEFITSLSICHSVKAIHSSDSSKKIKEVSPNNSSKTYKKGKSDNYTMKLNENEFASAYCEEVATFKILKKFGYQLVESKKNLIQIKNNNTIENFKIIGHNKYHESRKKMSVVIDKGDGINSILLCKAYDISAFDLLNPKKERSKVIEKSKNQIKELTKLGFRYFILFKRRLNIKETSDFIKKYKNTENYIVKSEEHLNKLAIEYEKNLSFLGIIFFKEIIDPDLKYSTFLLRKSGIKIWIASGDTKENVL
jgi:magnesium-transporting ATPase (P-type)